jgi:outer membrane protein TolC
MQTSKRHEFEEKVVTTKTPAVPGLWIVFLGLFALSVTPIGAQIPGQPGASSTMSQSTSTQPETVFQTPPVGVFSGSARLDKVTPDVLKISILDAIDRGIRHNLGLLLSQEQTQAARAQYRRSLSALLPNVTGHASDSIQQINLAAFGIPLPAGLTSPVVGPFNVVDARGAFTQTIVDFNAMNRLRQSAETEKAAKFTMADARELVVLVVGNQYLQTQAAASRLQTSKTQLETAQTIFRQAQDQKNAGVAAGIDVLRAQVQMQTQQQRVLSAQDQYEQQKMAMARVIGLPVAQKYDLTDPVPYGPSPAIDIESSLKRAYEQRPEFLAAIARNRALELSVKAAKGELLPTAEINGDFGVLGKNFNSLENTYTVAAGVRIPIFQGGRARADVAQAESDLRQSRLQLEDLRNRIEVDVRSALLDVNTSAEQVKVAQSSIGLAAEQLKQSQDRFAAGVAGTLDVVQAQEAVATANESYIQALYLNNVAKLTLAHALGVAEERTKAFLGGK